MASQETPGQFGRRRWDRIQRALVFLGLWSTGVALGALILPLILAGEIYDYQDSVDGVHLPEVDAIVCLAGGRGRIAAAGDLWERYWEKAQRDNPPGHGHVPIFYVSGMGQGSTWRSFQHQLRAGVRDVLQPKDVILEAESENTEANATWLSTFAHQRGWNRVLLVTSAYHMRRAQLIFDRVLASTGQPIHVETLSIFQEPFGAGEWRGSLHGVHVTVQEYVKWVYYRYIWKRDPA